MSDVKTVPFKGTKEQEAELNKVIAKYKDTSGALIPVLHEVQDIYGYLPLEVQEMVADGLNISLAEVYGVVSFYTQFSLYPKGQNAIAVCLGTACYVKGSGLVLEKIKNALNLDVGKCLPDGKFSLEATRCIGACGLAPVFTINGEVYGRANPDDVEKILNKYIEK